MHQGDPAKEINLKIRGGVIELIVEDAGDGPSGDHAVWADAKFEYFEIAPAVVQGDFKGEPVLQDAKITAKLSGLMNKLPEISLPLKNY